MKTIFTLLVLICTGDCLMAQYCGHTGNPSGSGECNPFGFAQTMPTSSDSLHPFINGIENTTFIQFQNYDSVLWFSHLYKIQSLRIDSIGNLPEGLCWSTNKADNTFNNKEAGCIRISGIPCVAPGQYCLKIIQTFNFGINVVSDPHPDAYLLLRLKNLWDADTPIDTTQTFANPVIFYGNAAACTDIMDDVKYFNEIETPLIIIPNPVTNHAVIKFKSKTSGNFTQSITNLLGNEVYRKETDIIQGENRLTIDAGNLAAGIYFYSISNGISKAVKRIVIE